MKDPVRVFEIFMVLLLFVGPLVIRLASKALRYRAQAESETTYSAGDGIGALVRLYLGLLLAVLLIHLLREGAHWQMGPAYLAAVILVLLLVMPQTGRVWRLVASSLIVVLTAATCCFSAVLPMFTLPMPTGPHLVGTRIISMIDSSRKEDALAGSNPGAREIVVQIWYPAQRSHNPRAPYRRLRETSFASSYQSVDWTAARYDAPVAVETNGFPLVFYNPGWNGRRTQDTALVEDLASHGYVVAAIDHPYNSGPVQLEDGRVIRPIQAPELFDETSTKGALYLLIDREVEKETDDTLFALKQLTERNADSHDPLYHTMDLSKIAAIGYSLGGAVAAESAYRSAQIRAVVDLDTPLYGDAGKHGIAQPFLFLGEDLPVVTLAELSRLSFGERRNTEMDQDDYARQLPMFRRAGDYQLSIRGTLHTSFQDGIFFSPLHSISGVGSIAPLRMSSILREYTLGFLDQSLRGISSPLLASATSPFSEATILYRSTAAKH